MTAAHLLRDDDAFAGAEEAMCSAAEAAPERAPAPGAIAGVAYARLLQRTASRHRARAPGLADAHGAATRATERRADVDALVRRLALLAPRDAREEAHLARIMTSVRALAE